MKAFKVTYTVRPEFVAKNQKNIQAFLDEVKRISDPNMRYFVFLGADGKTFTHIAVYNAEEAQRKFLNLESFKSFQQQRDDSGLEAEPTIESYTLIETSHILF